MSLETGHLGEFFLFITTYLKLKFDNFSVQDLRCPQEEGNLNKDDRNKE